ncbi:MAG: DNA-protecting protein DprA [Chitinivibrionales bacterium]|nr:DNA-protecting protein DprA [Chitinivibrionales bacterium]
MALWTLSYLAGCSFPHYPRPGNANSRPAASVFASPRSVPASAMCIFGPYGAFFGASGDGPGHTPPPRGRVPRQTGTSYESNRRRTLSDSVNAIEKRARRRYTPPMSAEWIALNMVEGLGPVRFKHLLDCFGSPDDVLRQPVDRVVQTGGIPRDVAARIKSPALLDQAQRQLDRCRSDGVTLLTLTDPRYPELLREIFAPPPVLFIKGDLGVFTRNAFAVVGTRAPTGYGRRATSSITRDLTASGLCIVSGLALGIDAVAHQTALDAGGSTIAVLGCGIDFVYPSTNRALAARILERGALVSEFPLGSRPLRYNFPRRNRIISGLSAGVLVVEAGQRSGSLITASYALQQGRDVFAVPGPIFSDKSEGTFNLIRSGATPVRAGDEIVEAIRTLTHSAAPAGQIASEFPVELLTDAERTVLENLSDTPLRFDQLGDTLECPITELHSILLTLELKGAIRQLPGQQFVRD